MWPRSRNQSVSSRTDSWCFEETNSKGNEPSKTRARDIAWVRQTNQKHHHRQSARPRKKHHHRRAPSLGSLPPKAACQWRHVNGACQWRGNQGVRRQPASSRATRLRKRQRCQRYNCKSRIAYWEVSDLPVLHRVCTSRPTWLSIRRVLGADVVFCRHSCSESARQTDCAIPIQIQVVLVGDGAVLACFYI